MNKFEIIFGDSSGKSENNLYVKIEDLEMPHGEDYREAILELNDIINANFKNKPFLEHFLYDDFSTWWLIFPSVIPLYKKAINFVVSFEELIKKHNPSSVRINSNFLYFNLIQQICNQHNIKFEYSKFSFLKYDKKKSLLFRVQKKRFEKITETKIKNRCELFSKKYSHIFNLKNRIIFAIPTIYRRKIFNYFTLKSENGEYIQQPIMNIVNNQKQLLGLDVDYTFKGQDQILQERLETSMDWIPVEILLQSDTFDKIHTFLSSYEKLITDSAFQHLFTYREISLWPYLEDIFKQMIFTPNLPLYLRLYDSLTKLFKNEKPHSIFLPYETGPYALCLILAAQLFDIKTIGVAHAFIAKFMPMYSHNSCRSEQNPYGHPIPDVTLVFGDYSKKILVENDYPENAVISFGNPAFFNLEKIKSSLSKLDLRSKYGIPKSSKIALFTTGKLQPYYSAHGIYDSDVQILKNLLKKFSNNPEIFVILKPHPQEENTTVYENLINEFSANNFLITNDSLFELIYLSSVVISVFSTTMIDALCFDKPVIQVKIDAKPHPVPFEKYNATKLSSVSTISDDIINLLDNNSLKQELEKNRDIFLKDQYGIPAENPKKIISDLLGL